MPTSDARILANRQNAAKSTGPKTSEGKECSRANAYKHGLTGAGIVMPEEDIAEVERRTKALGNELNPPGEVGALLVRQIATLSVRMERSFEQETAAISDRVRQVMDEFEAPEGVDAETAAKLRIEAGQVALFDPSKAACLARKYEAAARRGFFRALADLRQLKKEAKAADPDAAPRAARQASEEAMGSFLRVEKKLTEMESRIPDPVPFTASRTAKPLLSTEFAAYQGGVDVPITIGRRR